MPGHTSFKFSLLTARAQADKQLQGELAPFFQI